MIKPRGMIKPVHDENGVTIYHSNSIFAMMGMPDNSVDSIVTDPPYGLSFMGKKWDYSVPSVQLWQEALRVLKPGGHLLSFAGSRTYHRMAVNIEDAGFEIRDQIMWIYGSGFPKSLDIGKAIDKAAGIWRGKAGEVSSDNGSMSGGNYERTEKEPAVTPEAKQWDGWGTALKPAHEPIVVARKPLIGTVAENVLKHGTGGINIDGGRVEFKNGDSTDCSERAGKGAGYDAHNKKDRKYGDGLGGIIAPQNDKGRFPANIIFDAEAGAMLDKQSGDFSSSSSYRPPDKGGTGNSLVFKHDEGGERGHNDSGGASRFFYCAKASKQDRDEGLEGMAEIRTGAMQGNLTDSQRLSGKGEPIKTPVRANHHPTVKPTALMQYLCRLVTPPGGTTLDPFTGSGSTGKAAVREGFKFIGCELTAEYIPIIIARINAPAQVELL